MTRIEENVLEIKDSVSKMMTLVGTQIERSRSAVFDFNKDLVEEITASEKTVNSLDLRIDSDCEKTLALLSPVADDLRLILSVLKINTYLERMGDNAQSIAKSIHDFDKARIEAIAAMQYFDITVLSTVNSKIVHLWSFEEQYRWKYGTVIDTPLNNFVQKDQKGFDTWAANHISGDDQNENIFRLIKEII